MLPLALAFAVALVLTPAPLRAQTDEIQVYEGGLAGRGVFNLTLHDNYTPRGLAAPAFPGAVIADKSFNGVPEWAYGVASWFEAGLYLPLYSRDKRSGWGLDGFKLRALFAVPRADERRFVYGVNFETSDNARRWDTRRITSEIRPILGWHWKPIDVFVNPILDTSYDGLGNIVFAPATRVAWNVTRTWVTGVEEYAEMGPLRGLRPWRQQSHQVYGIVGRSGPPFEVEAGVGFGLTPASDKLTLKLILSRDLNRR